jgi:hypothetical protein
LLSLVRTEFCDFTAEIPAHRAQAFTPEKTGDKTLATFAGRLQGRSPD